ncbi:hypothetical protein HK101_010943 [Irineochytrium annulatum]|nr:hypothetical protein HK101_010943 [Irineochytrium annulatum]
MAWTSSSANTAGPVDATTVVRRPRLIYIPRFESPNEPAAPSRPYEQQRHARPGQLPTRRSTFRPWDPNPNQGNDPHLQGMPTVLAEMVEVQVPPDNALGNGLATTAVSGRYLLLSSSPAASAFATEPGNEGWVNWWRVIKTPASRVPAEAGQYLRQQRSGGASSSSGLPIAGAQEQERMRRTLFVEKAADRTKTTVWLEECDEMTRRWLAASMDKELLIREMGRAAVKEVWPLVAKVVKAEEKDVEIGSLVAKVVKEEEKGVDAG